MVQVIKIPTINDTTSDFETLFSIRNQVSDPFQDVHFEFSTCRFLSPNAVAFLGGLARLLASQEKKVVFDWDTIINIKVRMNLRQNGFAGTFGYPSASWDGNCVPYREDIIDDSNQIMDYLTDSWLGKGWVNVSQRLRDAIVGQLWEIYANAFEHAGSKVGVFSCGQHFPAKKELSLAVVDFGQGIVANVRKFLNRDPRSGRLTAAGCLRWAFQPGTTTLPNGMARGLGLDLLKQFVRVNHGRMEVYSNDGYVIVSGQGERFNSLATPFEGTMFYLTLKCDEALYRFADEPYNSSRFF